MDVISGQQLQVTAKDNGMVQLNGHITAQGLLGVISVPEIDHELETFLDHQRFILRLLIGTTTLIVKRV